jgi:hypothetical protein
VAGRGVVDRVKEELQFLAKPSWEKRVLGVLLYGSWARGDAGPDSDIDICLVAPEAEDKSGLWREFVSHLRSEKYDVRIFEILPLYIKMAVIEEGSVLRSRDVLELYEYFYPFRREWDDQKHRHTLSAGEVKELIAAARRARAGGGPERIAKF